MQFDDKPVGRSSGTSSLVAVSHEPDFSRLPVDQLLVHGSWRARKRGYELVSEVPQTYKSIMLLTLPKLVTESNAAAQESLFDALLLLVSLCSEEERAVLCSSTAAFVVDKGLTGRPKAVKTSQTYLTLLVELGKQAEVFDALMHAFTHKSPRNRLSAAHMCGELVRDFGLQNLPHKALLKCIQPLFNDSNAQVRKEASELCCQCYRYMGPELKAFLTDLREVQLQELERQFDKLTPCGEPRRRIRGAVDRHSWPAINGSAATTAATTNASAQSSATAAATRCDGAFGLLPEGNVLGKLPHNFFATALDKSARWQDRCEYVNRTLMPLLAAPRFRAKDNYHELASLMREYLLDPQAPLMLLGFRMIQECARGLRGDFAPHARAFLAPLFDKMKDKKTSVLEHVMTTLDMLVQYQCVSFDQYLDEIESTAQSRNPAQRLALLNFCRRMVNKLEANQFARLARSMSFLKRMLNDEKPAIREAAYRLLNHFIQVFGETEYRSLLDAMDEKQRARVRAAGMEGGNSLVNTPLATPSSALGATPSSSPAKKVARVEGCTSVAVAKLLRRPGSTVQQSQPLHTSAPPSMAPSAATASCNTSADLGDIPVRAASHNGTSSTRGGLEDAIALESTLPPKLDTMEKMLGLLEGDTTVLDLVRSSEWGKRQDGIARIRAMTERWSERQCGLYLPFLVVYLDLHPSWRESTGQVLQAMLQTVHDVLARATSVSPGAACALLTACTPRLTEPRHRQAVRELCSLIASRLGLRFVLRHMMTAATQVRTPRLLLECNDYFTGALNEYAGRQGAQGQGGVASEAAPSTPPAQDQIDIRGVVEYLRATCLEQQQQLMRSSALQVLLALRRCAGAAAAVDLAAGSFSPAVQHAYAQELQRVGEVACTSTRPSGAYRALHVGDDRGADTAVNARNNANDDDDEEEVKGGGAVSGETRQRRSQRRSGSSAATKRVRALSESPTVRKVQTKLRAATPTPRRGSRASLTTGLDATQDTASAALLPPPPPSSPPTSCDATATAVAGRGSAMVHFALPTGSSPRASVATTSSETTLPLKPIVHEITHSTDWRARLEAVRRVESYIAGNEGVLPAHAMEPLLRALGGRLGEANRNFVVEVLRVMALVVEAGAGCAELRRGLRRVLPAVLSFLGDQKVALREAARQVLFLAVRVLGIDGVLPLMSKALSSESNVCRQNALEAMVFGFQQLPGNATVSRANLQMLVPYIVQALLDRLQEVRLAAEQVLGRCITILGEEAIRRCVQQLKEAERQLVLPAVERQVHDGGYSRWATMSGTGGGGGLLRTSISSAAEASSAPPVVPTSGGARVGVEGNGRSDTAIAKKHVVVVAPPTPHEKSDAVVSGAGLSAASPSDAKADLGGPPVRRSATPVRATATRGSRTTEPSRTARSSSMPALSATALAARRNGGTATPAASPVAAPAAMTPKGPRTATPSYLRDAGGDDNEKNSRNPCGVGGEAEALDKCGDGVSHDIIAAVVDSADARPPHKTEDAARAEVEMAVYSIQEIIIGLRTATPHVAYVMCTDFMRYFNAGVDCGSPEMIQVMVERLYANTRKLDVELALGLIGCLTAMFVTPRSVQRCHSSLLFRLFGSIFDCLLSEQFALNDAVIRALNSMTLKLLENSEANNSFSALLSRMTNYSTAYVQSGSRADLKYVQVTVKCIMRVDLHKVSLDNVVLCCHEYLMQHPPSAFRHLDDLPIRTVKTILQSVTTRAGDKLLDAADRLVGSHNLVTHFIRACLEFRAKSERSRDGNEQQLAVVAHREQERASQSPVPSRGRRGSTPHSTGTATAARTPRRSATAHVDPFTATLTLHRQPAPVRSRTPTVTTTERPATLDSGAAHGATTAAAASTRAAPLSTDVDGRADETDQSMAAIFGRIRNHVTTLQGIDDLYTCLRAGRTNTEEEFNVHFARCSEAFRQYIKRRLERKVVEDEERPSTFQLPRRLQELA